MFKKLFGGGGGQKQAEQDLSIDDLIVLERYEEAEGKLQARLRSNPRDLHHHLKLADVYIGLRQASKAVDEYIYVAEEYTDDGFHDKALALLARAQKLAPADVTLAAKIEKIKDAKKLEHSRVLAIEGILAKGKGSANSGSSALEMQRLWHNLSSSQLVRRLEGEQLKRLFAAMDLERIGSDVVVVERQGSLEKLMLVVEGTIEAVATLPNGSPTVLRSFTSGDIIGDRALFERRPWAATYRTTNTVTVLSLLRPGLEQALLGNPDPRGFISALRAGSDQEVAAIVQKLGV